MTSPRGPTPIARRRGFTLLEVGLTIALLAMLAGTAVVGLSGWQRAAALNEGTAQFATLLRAARVEASALGKRLQLAFEPGADAVTGDAGFHLLWEPDPFEAPGEFVPYGGLADRAKGPADLVRVRRCRLTGDSAYRLPPREVDADLQPVMFYPDGSSDSATVVLISTNPRDRRGAVVDLNGLSGMVTTDVIPEERFEQWLSENP